jgi:hypothetical protein
MVEDAKEGLLYCCAEGKHPNSNSCVVYFQTVKCRFIVNLKVKYKMGQLWTNYP